MRKIALAGALAFACAVASGAQATPTDIGFDPTHPIDACCGNDATVELLHHGKPLDTAADPVLSTGELTAFSATPEQDWLGLSSRAAWSSLTQAVPQLGGFDQQASESLVSRPIVRVMIALGALTFVLRLRKR